jgi:hypothetical protein
MVAMRRVTPQPTTHAQPTNGHATRSAEKRAPRAPGVIRIDELYTLDEFRSRTGLGEQWLRTARRTGLRVLYLGGRAFVRGRDFVDFLEKSAGDEFRPKEPGESGPATDAGATELKRQRPSSARDSAAS